MLGWMGTHLILQFSCLQSSTYGVRPAEIMSAYTQQSTIWEQMYGLGKICIPTCALHVSGQAGQGDS